MVLAKLKRLIKKRKFYYKGLKWATLLSILLIVISNLLVEKTTSKRIYSYVDSIPAKHVGLLLGTNKFLRNGNVNLYYKYRIKAAHKLIKSGKVKYLIVSGDNSKKNYNEPVQMRDDLIKMGVPLNKIILDYAGFRTLDSVVRSKEIFGQSSITIISQPFHNKRALFIAMNKDIDAIAYNAKAIKGKYGFKVKLRELFARVKLMIDLYIINKKPKFLGEKISIPA